MSMSDHVADGTSLQYLDRITVARAMALNATLDREGILKAGDPLPELWHWVYFWPIVATSELGADGHPRKGNFIPDLGLPRRMWAGGRLLFNRRLEVGSSVSRTSTIERVEEKAGRSGRLGFVTVKHRFADEGGVAIEEEQDIVYREAYAPGGPAPDATPAPKNAAWQREISPSETMLFRYSALTFNSHRIHYDRTYAVSEEGYANLVVHGPLIATLLMDLVHRKLPLAAVRRFSFKAVRPTMLGNAFVVCGEPSAEGDAIEMWAKDHEGWVTMRARAELV
jgi:3-methylfumaryl-CoA hydratase